MSHRSIAEFSSRTGHWGQPIVFLAFYDLTIPRVLRTVGLALQRIVHFFDKIIDKQKFKFHRRVVNRDRQVICNIVAEGTYRTVVVGPHPFSDKVRKSVDIDRCACLLRIARMYGGRTQIRDLTENLSV